MSALILRRAINIAPLIIGTYKCPTILFDRFRLRAVGSGLQFYSSKINQLTSDEKKEIEKWETQLSLSEREELFNIRLELTMKFEEGLRVSHPDKLKVNDWKSLLTLRTKAARIKRYSFLNRIMHVKEQERLEKEEQRIIGAEIKKKINEERKAEKHIVYGLGNTTLMTMIFPGTTSKWRNQKVWRGIQMDNPKIIFDMDYDNYMTSKNRRYTADHLFRSIVDNRFNTWPFDIHLCSVNMANETMSVLESKIPNITSPTYPIHLHTNCFSEHFPRDRLVYLTPYASKELGPYNPNDIFVIPAVIDRGYRGPITMIKAKQLGIRTAYFPITKYFSFIGNKGLPLNLIAKILADFKDKRDWRKALQHFPVRKIRKMRREPRKPLITTCGKNMETIQMPISKRFNPFVLTEPNEDKECDYKKSKN